MIALSYHIMVYIYIFIFPFRGDAVDGQKDVLTYDDERRKSCDYKSSPWALLTKVSQNKTKIKKNQKTNILFVQFFLKIRTTSTRLINCNSKSYRLPSGPGGDLSDNIVTHSHTEHKQSLVIIYHTQLPLGTPRW